MPAGRPTDDPKTELVAFRLAPRQLRWLKKVARRQRVTLSEALRLVLDEAQAADRSASGPSKLRRRARGPGREK